jgi:hypothetical protein
MKSFPETESRVYIRGIFRPGMCCFEPHILHTHTRAHKEIPHALLCGSPPSTMPNRPRQYNKWLFFFLPFPQILFFFFLASSLHSPRVTDIEHCINASGGTRSGPGVHRDARYNSRHKNTAWAAGVGEGKIKAAKAQEKSIFFSGWVEQRERERAWNIGNWNWP